MPSITLPLRGSSPRPPWGVSIRWPRVPADLCRCFARDRGGAAALEMALVAVPFFALLIAALQIGLFFLCQSALEVATEKAARTVLTGSAQSSGLTQQQFLASVCSKLPSILACANLMVDAQVYSSFSGANTSTPTMSYNGSGAVSNQWNYNIGGPNDIVVLRVMYLLPVVSAPLGFKISNTLNNKRLLMATAVFKNEPY